MLICDNMAVQHLLTIHTIKNLLWLKKAHDPYKAFLNYRNTPLDGFNLSPAQLLMGRGLKTSPPTKVELLAQRSQEIQQHFQKRKTREMSYYDQPNGKELTPELQVTSCLCIIRMSGSGYSSKQALHSKVIHCSDT